MASTRLTAAALRARRARGREGDRRRRPRPAHQRPGRRLARRAHPPTPRPAASRSRSANATPPNATPSKPCTTATPTPTSRTKATHHDPRHRTRRARRRDRPMGRSGAPSTDPQAACADRAREHHPRAAQPRRPRTPQSGSDTCPHDGVIIGQREWATGDRVIARRNDHQLDIDNGTLATITGFDHHAPDSCTSPPTPDSSARSTPLLRPPRRARLRDHRPRQPRRHRRERDRDRPPRGIHPRMGLHRALPRPRDNDHSPDR